jgi:hypothetical protein
MARKLPGHVKGCPNGTAMLLAALDGCAGADGYAEVTAWREELFRRAILNRNAGNYRSAFKRIKDTPFASHSIVEQDGRVCRAH